MAREEVSLYQKIMLRLGEQIASCRLKSRSRTLKESRIVVY